MDISSSRPVAPASPTRNTGPLRPTEAPAATQPAAQPRDASRRGDLMNEATQFEYGAMPWGEEKPTPKEMATEDLERVIADHVADPCKIDQVGAYTCVATTMQRWLAANDPAAYTTMVTDLQTKGEARLPNGELLKLSDENLNHINGENLTPERRIDLLMQTAIMDYANGEGTYDAKTGQTGDRSGLSTDEAKAVFEKIAGKHTQFVGDIQGYETYDAFMADLKAKTDKGQWVCLPLNQSEVFARQNAQALFDQASMNHSAQFWEVDSNNAFVNQFQDEANQAAQDAEFTGQMAHLVEIAEVDDAGNVTAFDPREKTFVKLTKQQFMEALQAAIGDDLGGTLSYASTSQSRPAPRPPAPPPPPLRRG